MASRPARTLADGVDLSQHIRSAAGLRAADKTFAVRYLSPDSTNNPEKQLRAAELADCMAHGVSVPVVWETTATRATAGYAAGYADAGAADMVARSLGMAGVPIHWAIDFDATGAQVEAYARGWVARLGVDRCGAYGGIRPLAYLLDRNLITYAWQTYAWSGGELEPRATAYQWQNDVTVAGNNCDLDAALAHDFGQWPRPTNPPDQGVDMPLTQADADLVAATLLKARVDNAGPPPTDPTAAVSLAVAVRASYFRDGYVANTAVPAIEGAQATEAAGLEALHAELASLPAGVVAALPEPGPGGTFTLADVQAAAANAVTAVMNRTTAALTVAPPAAGASGG